MAFNYRILLAALVAALVSLASAQAAHGETEVVRGADAALQITPWQIYKQQCAKRQPRIDSLERVIKGEPSLSEKGRLLRQLSRVCTNMPCEDRVLKRTIEVCKRIRDVRTTKECVEHLCRLYCEQQNLEQVRYWLEEMKKLAYDEHDHNLLMAKYYEITTLFWTNDMRSAWNETQMLLKRMTDTNDKFGIALCQFLEAQIYSFVGSDQLAYQLVDKYLPVLAKSGDLTMVSTAYDASALYCFVVGEVEKGSRMIDLWEKRARSMRTAPREYVEEALWAVRFNRSLHGVYVNSVSEMHDALVMAWTDNEYVPTRDVLNQYVVLRCSLSLLENNLEGVQSDVAYLLENNEHYKHQYYYMLSTAYARASNVKEASVAMRKAVEVLHDNFSKNFAREMTQYGQLTERFGEEKELDAERLHDARLLHTVIMVLIGITIVAMIVLMVVLYLNLHKKRRLQVLANDLQEKHKEMERLNAHLAEAISEESLSNRKKNEFNANISHEIRTPLNAIVGFSEVLSASLEGEENTEYSSIIRTNSDLMLKLVNEIIDKQNETGYAIDLEEVDVVQLGRQVLMSLKALLNDDVEMRFFSDSEVMMLHTDRFRLQQLLTNLIGNAAKFTEKGHITLSISADENNITFAVTDTGIGIEQGKETAIFEKFERVSDNVQGSGLGLYICRGISHRLRGNLYVDKTYRQGARFVFKHPKDLKLIIEGKEVVK